MIEADFTEFIDDDQRIRQSRVTQELIEQSGFPAAEETRENA